MAYDKNWSEFLRVNVYRILLSLYYYVDYSDGFEDKGSSTLQFIDAQSLVWVVDYSL